MSRPAAAARPASAYPNPSCRRALELLADCPQEGCTEALMLAHGFTIAQSGQAGPRWARERERRAGGWRITQGVRIGVFSRALKPPAASTCSGLMQCSKGGRVASSLAQAARPVQSALHVAVSKPLSGKAPTSQFSAAFDQVMTSWRFAPSKSKRYKSAHVRSFRRAM